MATSDALSLDEYLGSTVRTIEASARSDGLAEIITVAASAETPQARQVRIIAAHAMRAEVEAALFNRAAAT